MMYLVGSGSFVRCSIGSSSPPAADPNPSLASESLNLSSAIAGGTGFMLTVNGTNSVSPSTMQFSGNPLAASFVSGSPLQASIPAADIAAAISANIGDRKRSEEHTSELQSRLHLVCRLLLEKKKKCRLLLESLDHMQLAVCHW